MSEANLKYVYIPIIKKHLKIGNDIFDCMLNDLDFIPFYNKQDDLNSQERLKIAHSLIMYQIGEKIWSEDNLDLDRTQIHEKINSDLYENTMFDKNEYRQKLKEWYKDQDVEFIVLDVEKEDAIKIWNVELNTKFEEMFNDVDKLNKENKFGDLNQFDIRPILNPMQEYNYIDSENIVEINGIARTGKFDVIYNEAVDSKYLSWFLIEELDLLDKAESFSNLNYEPEELYIEFDVHGESTAQTWTPYRGWHAPDNYSINIKGKYNNLVDSGEDDEDYEDTQQLYETIIQDYIALLEQEYDYSLLTLGQSGGYFGFEKDSDIFEDIIVRLDEEMLDVVVRDQGPFSIKDFYNNILEEVETYLENCGEINEDDFDIVEVNYTKDFINFNKDVYTYIEKLSSGPMLKDFDEYSAWEEGRLEEYRNLKKKGEEKEEKEKQ